MENQPFDPAQGRPQQIQINLDPNMYGISNINMGFNPEEFHFMVMSGNQGRQYVATPAHAKRIYLLLKQQVENYEKQFGEIKTVLPQPSQPGKAAQASQAEENKIGF